jgi:MOSC domain-containing protein YiiM
MRLLSVNRSLPKAVEWQGKTITTGIFKLPVAGPVSVDSDGLQGDGQADLHAHGGIHKAVYAFPHEHYQHFAELLDRDPDSFPYGQFGENLSTEGMLESEIQIGDRFRIGNVELEVSQPRVPCFKLGIIMQDPAIIHSFLKSLRTGCYLRVLSKGILQSGDTIVPLSSPKASLSVADITRLRFFDQNNTPALHKAANLPALTPSWRDEFSKMASNKS